MKPLVFAQLYSIFNANDWHAKDGHELVFSSFCDLLGNLDEEQQNLLLELAERYTWLTFSEYQAKLVHMFKSIPVADIENLEKIYLFPVMKPGDEKKTKSGHGVLIILRGVKGLFFQRYEGIEFKEIEEYEYFDHPKFKMGLNDRIYLLDDFLGTGDTLKSCIDKLLETQKIPLDAIRVLSIASHTQAKEYMDDIGVDYYTDIITNRGISDHYITPLLEEKTHIMEEIEKLIPNKKYNFGYGKSEALITLYRTPNNTFPIFWHDYKKNDQTFKAPFPRY